MQLFNYGMYQDGILFLEYAYGHHKFVILDKNSGKVISRKKVNTISDVQHTGIWLGRDYYTKEALVIHNHYQDGGGTTHISTLADYAYGENVYWQKGACTNDWLTVLDIALDHVVRAEPYSVFTYNCQIFTSLACHSKTESEDLNKWIKRLLTVGATAVIFGVFTK